MCVAKVKSRVCVVANEVEYPWCSYGTLPVSFTLLRKFSICVVVKKSHRDGQY
jgi:hypothetical protein